MPVRTGAEYIRGLRERPRDIRINGEKVTDVTTYPGFRNGMLSIAALYDIQNDPDTLDEMTYISPTTGDRVGMSFLIPESVDDVQRKGRMMARWAQYHGGMMGRTPDFLNASFVAMAGASAYYAQNRPEFGENITRYYELMREQDLCLTHTLVNPQRSRRPANDLTDTLPKTWPSRW